MARSRPASRPKAADAKKSAQEAVCTMRHGDKKGCHEQKKCVYVGSKCKPLPLARTAIVGLIGVVMLLIVALVVYLVVFRKSSAYEDEYDP